ncbi:MAG: ABC transporter substrate-binding protein [Actinobacteria bacterium]|nr:ABC transporter substrate-binding protein [Actinomycetota bacterium]MCB9388813.1 ABC transporter substrate-binding protein [Acidimicrobiia bacterium]
MQQRPPRVTGSSVTRRDVIKRAGGLAGFFAIPGFAASLAACSDKSVDNQGSSSQSSGAKGDGAGSDDAIKVGVIVPTEGLGAFVGDVVARSLAIAENDINSKGGIGGRKISIVTENTPVEGMVDATKTSYDKLAGTDNMAGILWCTALGIPQIADGIKRDNMVVMSVFQDVSFERALWPQPDSARSVFQFLLSVEAAIDPIMGYASSDRQFKNVVMARDILLTGPFAEPLKEVYAQVTKDAGLEAFPDVEFTLGTTDFGPLVQELEKTNAECVFIAGGPDETALIARELANRDHDYIDLPTAKSDEFRPQLFGTPANMGERRWVDLAGDAAKVGSVTAWHLGGLLDSADIPIAKMAEAWKPGTRLTGGEESPADALYALLTGVDKAGSITDREKIITSIETAGPIEYAYLPFEFTADDHQRVKTDDIVLISLEREDGPVKTDPPYALGSEWDNYFKGQKYMPNWLVRPTLEGNLKAHPEHVQKLLDDKRGVECTLPDGEVGSPETLTNACKIH